MSILSDFQKIDTFIFDIDGVLTDGSVLVLENGEMARRMNIKDGYALQLAIKKGYRIFIVSGSSPSAVEMRLRYLGITEIFFNVKNKETFIKDLAVQHGFDLQKALFMGDDMPDLPVFNIVYLSCCPADAISEIQNAATFIATKKGGEGCVREVIEKVLKIKGDWSVNLSIAST